MLQPHTLIPIPFHQLAVSSGFQPGLGIGCVDPRHVIISLQAVWRVQPWSVCGRLRAMIFTKFFQDRRSALVALRGPEGQTRLLFCDRSSSFFNQLTGIGPWPGIMVPECIAAWA